MGETEAVWLVRSGNRIIGPLSSAKVKGALRTRDILPHDEIAAPYSRWRFVMYEPEFQETISELNGVATVDATRSIAEHTVSEDRTLSSTETVSNFSQGSLRPDMVTDVYVDEEQTVVDARTQKGADADYEFIREGTVKKELRRQKQSVWRYAVLIIIGVVGGVFYLKNVQRTADDRARYDDLLRRAILAKLHGSLPEAITLFREAANRKDDNLELYYHYGPLLIGFEKQSVMGRRLLEKLLSQDASGLYFSTAHTGMGLADILDGDLESAKRHFTEAVGRDPNFYPAIYNQGIIEYQKKQFASAVVKFQEAQRSVSLQWAWRDNSAILMEAISAYRQMGRDKNANSLFAALEHLDEYLKIHKTYLQEELLIKSWLQYLLDRKEQSRESLISMLNAVPGLSQQVVRDPLIYRDFLNWSGLQDYCSALTEELGEDPEMLSVKSMCLAQVGKVIEAGKVQERASDLAVGKRESLGLVKTVQAYLYYMMGKTGEARGALRATKDTSAPVLAAYVAGQICFEAGDFSCAEDQFSRILSKMPNQIFAVTRLAEIRMAMGERAEALELIAKSYEQGREYGPYLKLRHDLGRK